jgi:plasmid stabilization system protein ParE
MNLRFLPAAREELDAAASYLDERVAGLGGEFLDDVERTSALLCQFSQMGRRLDSINRALPLQRFSFNLIYRIFDGEAVVVAVAHKRRRPGYWRGRT